MVVLYPVPPAPARITPAGRPARYRVFKNGPLDVSTPAQVKMEAERLTTAGLGAQAWRTLDLLACGGVLPLNRLPATPRTIQRWANSRLVESLTFSAESILTAYQEVGLTETSPALYALGPLGVEIATRRFGIAPPTGYKYYQLARVMHDVLTNEVTLRLASHWATQGWTVEWLSKYEATLVDKEGKQSILEPDAFLRLRREEQSLSYAIEYHNENWQSRAADKVARYETAFKKGNWRAQWDVSAFPVVLTVFINAVVGVGYRHALQSRRAQREMVGCMYYGKKLEAVLQSKLDEWFNIATDQKEPLPGQAGT